MSTRYNYKELISPFVNQAIAEYVNMYIYALCIYVNFIKVRVVCSVRVVCRYLYD